MSKKKFLSLIPVSVYPVLDRAFSWCRGSLNLLFLKGSKYRCPVCHHSFKRLLHGGYDHQVLKEKKVIGGGRRNNAVCPFCFSMDRERLIYLFIQSQGLLQDHMRLLHIAPEKSLQQVIKKKNIDYYPADLDSPLAAIQMDIQQIAFVEGYFDAIICNHVLEHVPDDIKAMKELYRVLKPGGWAILQVPFSPILEKTFEDNTVTGRKERERVFGQSDHMRIYGTDYTDRLRSAGFEVSQEKMDTVSIQRYALLEDEVVFFCRKTG